MKRDKEELLLGYDLMDELTDDDVVQKKASDIVIKNDDERQLTAVEWYEEAYNESCDFVFVASKDILRKDNKVQYIERSKEMYEMLIDRFYYNGHTDVQVVTNSEKLIELLPSNSNVVFEPSYSPSSADGALIQNFIEGGLISFKVGIHSYKDPKRQLMAFMGFTAALYSLLDRETPATSYMFELFPRCKNAVESRETAEPDDFFEHVESDYGSYDNMFGPDFYYFKHRKVNMDYKEFENDLHNEIKEAGEELCRLGIIPKDYVHEAFVVMYHWAMKYLGKGNQLKKKR